MGVEAGMRNGAIRTNVETILRDDLRIIVPEADTDLLDSGLLDSLGLVEMIAAIEKQFGIVVDLMDLELDDVRTVEAIARLVEVRLP